MEFKQLLKQKSNSLIENKYLTSNSLIEGVLIENKDIIEEQWIKRHAKFCYTHGVPAYMELVHKARKYGKNPKQLLAFLINKEMDKL